MNSGFGNLMGTYPRCECHDCTQARYKMSQPRAQFGGALGGGLAGA